MATVTHTICSEYDPADRERLERETGQLDEGSDPWHTESSFSAQRRVRMAPSFVPAMIQFDEWGQSSQPSSLFTASRSERSRARSAETAQWYRSLARNHASPIHNIHQDHPQRPSSAPAPEEAPKRTKPPPRETINKNNWFISRVLRSEPSTTSSSPAPTLADILARDPPPLLSQERYKPPVWLHIGPTNKGFSMLQRSGWNEGEGLGAHAARFLGARSGALETDKEEAGETSSRLPTRNMVSSAKGKEAEAAMVHQRVAADVIDLTQSDSESDEEVDEGFEALHATPSHPQMSAYLPDEISASHQQKSLLTPIPTVLKADRLGIGLKAKTEGPYKRSKKRVTHNATALAAHIRSAEEMRKKRAEAGRGRRGFAKLHKREEERRKWMLAYLNE
ncbi:hypothetical protein J3A83DRAFT_74163 [Scleroderma citrinum]